MILEWQLGRKPSSAANVGTEKDSDKRQREAVQAFARRPLSELGQDQEPGAQRTVGHWGSVSSVKPARERESA